MIAITGDAALGGGNFSTFGSPVLNDAGQTAFVAGVPGYSGGIYRGDTNTIVPIVTYGQAVPGSTGGFRDFGSVHTHALNDAGQVAFVADWTPAGFFVQGIFRGDGETLTPIGLGGQPAPDGNGNLRTGLGYSYPAMNESGQVSFSAPVTVASDPFDDRTLMIGNGGPLTQIARQGQAGPGGIGTFEAITSGGGRNSAPTPINDVGQSAFWGRLVVNGIGGQGIFRGNGTTVTQIALEGQPLPGGVGKFSAFLCCPAIGLNDSDAPALNNAGQVAFRAQLAGTGVASDVGMYVGNGNNLLQIARHGQTVPDGTGTFNSFDGRAAINDAGQVAFAAGFTTSLGSRSGVFRADGHTLVQIARRDQAAADGNGQFNSFRAPALNAMGQAAFVVNLSGTSGGGADNQALYFYDDTEG
ncbi:MAG: choice-of-anchor tandem repeat NxxGxxAF-containing protein [Pirellulales bacterium]